MGNPNSGYGHADDGSYAGTISGAGALIKSGSGVLTLTGDHAFTGGTTITGGTLRLGEGGSSGMIAGNVVNNGTLIFERSDDVRFAGAISGSGAVVKAGDGVLTLTGEHTFTGGTSITGGSLRIGGGGTSGMIHGDINNDVYLTFDRSDNARYSGSISGSGSVWKAGAGQLELTGISTHTGQTIVQAGSVIINGRLTDSYMFVEAGARLGGGGSVNGFTIESGGRVAPGNSVGTLTVLGDVQFDPGSFFDVEIEGDRSDLLRVAGAAGIDGGTINVLGAAGGASSGRYTVLTAGSGVTGRFTAVADDLPDIDFVDVYDGSSVQLVARATANTSTLSAKSNGVAATAGVIETVSMFTSMLGGRMSGGPQPSATTAPLAYVSAGRGEAAAAIDQAVAPLHAEPSGLSVFVQGMGGTESVAGQGAASGLDASMGGVLGGIEYANLVSNTVFGVAGGYSASGVRVTDGSARLGTAHLGLYGSQGLGDLTLSGALGYHWGTIDLSRNIGFGGGGGTTATGSASMHAVTGSLEAFYDVGSQVGAGWSIGPVASLHAVNAYRGAYGETGAGILNLQVGADAVTRIDGNIGLRIGGEFDFGGFILTPQTELRYERQLINTAGSGQATIAQAGASFAPQVSTGAQDQLGIGLALGVEFADNFSVAASYDGSFGQGTQSHRGLATMSLKF
ncbi:autotransporter family protein [Devosia sediminis]|uniref:Autotransporter domain-containing protein n=1 Tax=Devosia sediminis TaxID=2798801 RepID=A0A934IZR3_9HYPH|nr:autotransporter outer membrane beta-barrel domain-containing protein [Devosia sediminis]MBJ3784949.1 autotransporter domain-containing protein [Devosia sediminis]